MDNVTHSAKQAINIVVVVAAVAVAWYVVNNTTYADEWKASVMAKDNLDADAALWKVTQYACVLALVGAGVVVYLLEQSAHAPGGKHIRVPGLSFGSGGCTSCAAFGAGDSFGTGEGSAFGCGGPAFGEGLTNGY